MLKPEEIRIGNWIDWKGTQVKVDINDIGQLYADHHYFDQSTPIRMHEEWLEMFGWKQIDKYTWSLNGWFIYKRKRGFVTGSKRREINFKYVHHLQNWWYWNNYS